MHFLIWILSGVLAGWLVGLVMKGRGYGLIWDLALGRSDQGSTPGRVRLVAAGV